MFVAIANSSHTLSWIKLFEDSEDLDVSLFGAEGSYSQDFKKLHYKGERLIHFFYEIILAGIQKLRRSDSKKNWVEYYLFRLLYITSLKRLRRKIIRIQPDVIHTLAFWPSGFGLLELLETGKISKSFKWIHTSRGSELSLNGFLLKEKLQKVIQKCDFFIADNQIHYQIALEMGLSKEKMPKIGIIPGSGGMDFAKIDKMSLTPNRKREKVLILPKAYDCPFSKASPIFEAFKICWSEISPCKIIMTAATEDAIMWFKNLPEEIQKSSQIMERIDRSDYLRYLKSSKVMLAPSLSDGIPNSLYEAMAFGVIPIVSPIQTIKNFCDTHQVNVVYAENLYPNQLADAIIYAINQLENADAFTEQNQEIVRNVANAEKIQSSMLEIYKKI